ncbi:MAG: soluble lytic murein transglycosylase [Acidobacteriota bacterium]|nr:soluble lytic murein transglycosylase [Acidobacteriota bacterium]
MPVKSLRVRLGVLVSIVISSLLTVSVLISSPSPAALVVPAKSERAWRHQPYLPENLYAPAAKALRKRDLQGARQELERVASQHPDQATRTQVVAGLYAQTTGDAALARDLLTQAADPHGTLEDWRLYLLASDAARQGNATLARDTYARLIADCPSSPLRPLAFLESAKLAAGNGDERLALDLVAQARRAGVDGEVGGELDSLAWRLGRKLDDPQAQRQAGLRLLVDDPLSSEASQVVRTFRALDGGLDWSRLLSPKEVLRRAQSFLDADSVSAALSTLDELPDEERGFEWHLLRARGLTQSGRGREAFDLLGDLLPATGDERTAVDWERVRATAESGDTQSASVYLTRLVSSHARLQLSEASLRRLYKDFLSAGLFAPAVDTLRLLRRIDPLDNTGAAALWERGWQDYRDGRKASAVETWTVLAELYPDGGDGHRGAYWKARVLEELGRPDEAREFYRGLVATSDTSDFYSRQALARLGETQAPEGVALAQAPAAAWPAEPALQRVKLLTDLGLDELASQELGLVAAVAAKSSRRDVLALKGLILCHKGELRSGLVLLREAFPALGGPYQATVPTEILFAYYPLPEDYAGSILAYSRSAGVPAHLVAGIIRQESAFDPRATSPVGARGLMQLMPPTAREMSEKVGVSYQPDRLYDPDLSVRLGTTYVRELLDTFDGNVELALAGYNGGPNRIRRLWQESGPGARLDDFVETLDLDESRNYVKRILVLADSYRQLYPSLG